VLEREPVDVVVIGGGVAGLACAAALDAAGLRVALVEARERLGGRILTIRPDGTALPVELGAEFVHGAPPALFAIFAEAGLTPVRVEQRSWRADADGLRPMSDDEEDEDPFDELDVAREPDRSVDDFLAAWRARHPEGDAAATQARRFVEGFHAADPARMSERALAHETDAEAAEGGDTQDYRLPEGYERVVAHLCARLSSRTTVVTGTRVEQVEWRPGSVRVRARGATGNRGGIDAAAAVVTLPVGVLAAPADATGAVTFDPPLPDKARAVAGLAMGVARRVVLRFREPVWTWAHRAPGVAESLDGLGFLFTPDAEVPVWWTPRPLAEPMLTGWLGGPRAERLVGRGDAEMHALALDALAGVLQVERERLAGALVSAHTYDWGADPFARGAYSWTLVGGGAARYALAAPVADTLFWAGEATHWAGTAGTVHGAIASGQRAAAEVLAARGWSGAAAPATPRP
jgi:monoamine oxidase